MRFIGKLLAPVVFWIAYALFRSPFARSGKPQHQGVMRLFRYAADHGNRRALSVYGHLLHFRGEGVSNRVQGAIYLQRAADLGDMKAQYQMGRIFEQGFEHYFQPDSVKAKQYYALAAKQGHMLAQRWLEPKDV
jgi:TPR repeat protein